MFRTSIHAALTFSALMLAGCAHDKLLRQETQAFAATAQKSSAQGREFYERQIRDDRELWASLYQLDRKCTPASFRPSYFRLDGGAGALCSERAPSPGEPPSSELSRSHFAHQYAALKFIESYLVALTKAAGDPTLDASKDFAAAAADLNTLLTTFGMQTMAEDRTTAIGELVGLVEELSKERKSAKAIRAIVAEKRQGAESAFQLIVDSLKQDTGNEKTTRAAMLATLAMVGNASDAGVWGRQSGDARRKFLELRYRDIDEKERILECERNASDKTPAGVRYSEKALCVSPAAGMMQAAQQAHREFLGLIDGRLSKAQKEKLIKLQRQNLMRAIKLYLGLVAAF